MTTYAFVRSRGVVVFTASDPVEVKRAWGTEEFRHLPLRVLRDGDVHHATVEEARAVYKADAA